MTTNGKRHSNPRLRLPEGEFLWPPQLEILRTHVRLAITGSRRSWTDHLIVEIFACSGVRAQELCDLTWRDLCTLDESQLAEIERGRKTPTILVRHGKRNKKRVVDVPGGLIRLCVEYRRLWRTTAELDNPMIVGAHNEPLMYAVVRDKLRRIGASMPGAITLRPHMLRHAYAIKLYAETKDLVYVATQLGHTNLADTMIYVRTVEPKRADYSRLMA